MPSSIWFFSVLDLCTSLARLHLYGLNWLPFILYLAICLVPFRWDSFGHFVRFGIRSGFGRFILLSHFLGSYPLFSCSRHDRNAKKRGLAEKLEVGSWQISADGREYVESGGKPKAEPKAETDRPKPEPTETAEFVPSQAHLFRTEGERLGVGRGKGEIKLDAIVNYVRRIANLDDLNSVWNALTEMAVANDVKKR